MGTSINAGGDASGRGFAFDAPVDIGLLYMNLFGPVGASLRNLATGGAVGYSGGPVANPGYIACGQPGWIETGIMELPAFTYIAAFAEPSAGQGPTDISVGIGTYAAGGHSGSSLFLRNGQMIGAVTGTSGGGESVLVPTLAAPGNGFFLGAARFDGNLMQVDNLTAATKATGTIVGARQLSGLTYRVGAAYGGAGAAVNIAGVALYSRSLSDSELAAMAAPFQAWGAKFGITL